MTQIRDSETPYRRRETGSRQWPRQQTLSHWHAEYCSETPTETLSGTVCLTAGPHKPSHRDRPISELGGPMARPRSKTPLANIPSIARTTSRRLVHWATAWTTLCGDR